MTFREFVATQAGPIEGDPRLAYCRAMGYEVRGHTPDWIYTPLGYLWINKDYEAVLTRTYTGDQPDLSLPTWEALAQRIEICHIKRGLARLLARLEKI